MEFQPRETIVYGRQLDSILTVGPSEAAARKVGQACAAGSSVGRTRDRKKPSQSLPCRLIPNPQPPHRTQGFRLQEQQIDQLLLGVRDLQGVIITADPQLTPEENVEVLLDTVRLLQTGLEVQTNESDALVRDFQALQQEAQVRRPSCLAQAGWLLDAGDGHISKQPSVSPMLNTWM